jgi:hypothetical protein
MYAAQQEVIAALWVIDETNLADRLERGMMATLGADEQVQRKRVGRLPIAILEYAVRFVWDPFSMIIDYALHLDSRRGVRLLHRHTLKGIFQGSHWYLDQATRGPIEIDDKHDDGGDHQRHHQ